MVEWIKRVRVAAEKCKYQELNRQLKEQFIHGINNQYIQRKKDSNFNTMNKSTEVTSDQVLMWTKQEEALRTKALEAFQTESKMRQASPCRYCRSIHPSRKCPTYCKTFGECGRVNHFSAVCRVPRQAAHRLEEQEDGQTNRVNTDHFICNSICKRSSIETKLKN